MIKKFLNYYKPYKPLLILNLGTVVALSLLDMVFPTVIRKLVDEYLPLKSLKIIIISGLFLIFIVLLKGICQYIITLFGHQLGAKIEKDMRDDIFKHVLKLPVSFFDDNKKGNVMSYIVNDLDRLGEISHHFPEDILTSIVLIVGSFIIVFSYNWVLVLCLLCFLPVLLLFTYHWNKKMQKAFFNVNKNIGGINAEVNESLEGIRVVKSFTNEKVEMEKIGRANLKLLNARNEAFKAMAEFFSGGLLFTSSVSIFALIISSYLVYKDHLTIGQMIGTIFYSNLLLTPVNRIVNSTEALQQGMACLKRFYSLLDNARESYEPSSELINTCEKLDGAIAFEQVDFGYHKEKRIIDNFTLYVEPGQTVAIVGSSGVGKTTLCNLLARFYEIEKGRIIINGVDTGTLSLEFLRGNIGIVQQDIFLFSGTIEENIRYGKPEAGQEEVLKAAMDAYAHEFIMDLPDGYQTVVGERGLKLSGGQRQRISLARMFLKNPPILILDEATSALDNESEKIIKESIKKLSQGKTTFIISHRLSTIEHADHILVMTKNGIEEQGTHGELLEMGGVYKKLYS